MSVNISSGFQDSPFITSTQLPPFEQQNNIILLKLNILLIIALIFILLNLLFLIYIVVEFVIRRINIQRGCTLLIEESNPPEYSI